MMKYIFVIQWPGSSMEDYDEMVAIENLLISTVSKNSRVDGHDVGSDEVNIFIETNDPQRLYDEVTSLLGSHEAWSNIRLAYRSVEGDAYTVLWPKNLGDFDVH
jgi:hypothetical protein